MKNDRHNILLKSVKRLLRRDAIIHLRKIANKTHGADLSMLFRSLSVNQQHIIFNLIEDTEQKGILLSQLDENDFLALSEGLEIESFVKVLECMASDDAADLIGRLPEEQAAILLEKMKNEDSDEVEELLNYEDDTAGGIMVTDFIALKDDTTAEKAIRSLQKEHMDVEMPFYLYVVDEYGNLMGVCSLRQLVVVPPETPLKEFMTTEVFSVTTDTDQEEVAKIVARYDILAVPVVDETNKLAGIVTVDDVIDIFRQEATEDILKMAGVGEEFVETQSVIRSTRKRVPWLFASCLGGVIASIVIGSFEASLSQVAYLAAFIPVIMGMGGNVGIQSSTIVVRGLATGRFNVRDVWAVVSKELVIGLILGAGYGVLIGAVAQFRYHTAAVALSAGLGILSSMSIASLMGSIMPMLFVRINIDPAVATGPFVTSSIDFISVFFYLYIATRLLGI